MDTSTSPTETDTSRPCAIAHCTYVASSTLDLADHTRANHMPRPRRAGTRIDRARFDRMRDAAAAAARAGETVCVGCPFRACPSCRWQGGVG